MDRREPPASPRDAGARSPHLARGGARKRPAGRLPRPSAGGEGSVDRGPPPDEAPNVHSSSETYADRFAGPVGRWFLEVQARHVLRFLDPLPSGATVLDVGGGHAQLTPWLTDAGLTVLTVGSTARSGARVRPFFESGRCSFVTSKLHELPFPDAAFDGVVCVRILPHVADWRRLVAELCRVSGRMVVIDYPSVRSVNLLAERAFALKKRIEGSTRPFTVFDPRRIAGAFEAHGFRLADERGQYVFPMALHRALGSRRASRWLEAAMAAAGLARRFGSPVIVRADRRRNAGAGAGEATGEGRGGRRRDGG